MVSDIGAGSDRLMSRVQLAMEDKRKEKAVKATSASTASQDTSATRRGKFQLLASTCFVVTLSC